MCLVWGIILLFKCVLGSTIACFSAAGSYLILTATVISSSDSACMCAHVHAHTSHSMCLEARKHSVESLSSSTFMWVLENELILPGLHSKCFYPLSLSTGLSGVLICPNQGLCPHLSFTGRLSDPMVSNFLICHS